MTAYIWVGYILRLLAFFWSQMEIVYNVFVSFVASQKMFSSNHTLQEPTKNNGRPSLTVSMDFESWKSKIFFGIFYGFLKINIHIFF